VVPVVGEEGLEFGGERDGGGGGRGGGRGEAARHGVGVAAAARRAGRRSADRCRQLARPAPACPAPARRFRQELRIDRLHYQLRLSFCCCCLSAVISTMLFIYIYLWIQSIHFLRIIRSNSFFVVDLQQN
jgi:hypothetical protein